MKSAGEILIRDGYDWRTLCSLHAVRFILLVFALLLSPLASSLQAVPSPGLPFEFRDGLIWVKIDAPGCTLHFVLDSGAESSVISFQTAKRLGVKLGSPQTVHAVSSLVRARRVEGFKACLAGVQLKCDPLALDLSAMSRSCSWQMDGLIGQEFFQGRIVQINYKTHLIYLFNKSEAPADYVANLPLQYRQGALCIPLSVAGSRPRWIRLDTGCYDGVHWVDGKQFHKNDLHGATIQLGDLKLEKVQTVFHRTPIFPGEAGLLGNGILSRFKVTIDSISKRVWFESNSSGGIQGAS